MPSTEPGDQGPVLGRDAAVELPSPFWALDLRHLREVTLNDRALEIELLDLFTRQANQILRNLNSSNARDPKESARRADLLHTLCGSARAIGAWDVAAGAERLERHERNIHPVDETAGAEAEDGLAALERSVSSACAAIGGLTR